MAEYIEREAAIRMYQRKLVKCDEVLDEFPVGNPLRTPYETEAVECRNVIRALIAFPAADVQEVVLCGECYLHTHCRTEDVFDFAGLREENRFCAVGKRKTNGAKMEVQDG